MVMNNGKNKPKMTGVYLLPLSYAVSMVFCFFLGNHFKVLLFEFGLGSLCLLFISFQVLSYIYLKETPREWVLLFKRNLLFGIISILFFFFISLIFSLRFNIRLEFSLEGALNQLPNIVAAVVIYGIFTLIFIVISSFINLFIGRNNEIGKKIEDHLIEK